MKKEISPTESGLLPRAPAGFPAAGQEAPAPARSSPPGCADWLECVPPEWAAILFDLGSAEPPIETGPEPLLRKLRAWLPSIEEFPRRGLHSASISKANPDAGEEELFVMGEDWGQIVVRRGSRTIAALSQGLPRPVTALALSSTLRNALRTWEWGA